MIIAMITFLFFAVLIYSEHSATNQSHSIYIIMIARLQRSQREEANMILFEDEEEVKVDVVNKSEDKRYVYVHITVDRRGKRKQKVTKKQPRAIVLG